MKFRFHEKLYSDGFSDKKLRSIESNIKRGKLMPGIFIITLPIMEDGILEIYRYAEFLLPIYKEHDGEVTVVGVAKSKEDAFSLVERIVKDVGVTDGKLIITDFFGG